MHHTVATQTTMGEQAFPTFPCNSWRTVYLRNKKSARQEGWACSTFSMEGSPSWQCNVFSINKNFDSLSRVNSVKVGKSMHGRGVESRWLGQRGHLFSHINARFSLSGWKCDFKSNLRCALVQFWNHAYETGSWSLWVSAPCSSIGDVSKWICWLGAVITRLKFDPVPHHDYLFLYFRVGNMRNFIFWHFIIVNKKRGKKAS